MSKLNSFIKLLKDVLPVVVLLVALTLFFSVILGSSTSAPRVAGSPEAMVECEGKIVGLVYSADGSYFPPGNHSCVVTK